ncbi:cupin domain-containing protein [Candidatus Gottesmanbacteria bacterium]|nr:cupin domain-containing protein [Candidatus Gottesmanbacteria bacterium]
MKIVNIKKVKKQQLGPPFFTGKVTRQSPVTDNEGSDLSIDYVYFKKGLRTKFHKHANDQVLIITKGNGIVSTKKKVARVKKGDVVWSPANETHWHGATSDSSFSYISVTRSNTKLTQIEE